MNRNSPLFVIIPGLSAFVMPVGSLVDSLKDKKCCMNCRHFHQMEDWREALEGFYLPKGECRANSPSTTGFPKLHGGKHCGEFQQK